MTSINSSTFQKNSSILLGGAIHNDPSAVISTISNSLFANNSSESNGGAISNFNGFIDTIVNTTFSYNIASNNGGAIANSSYGFINNLFNSTIASNIAGKTGGGIWSEGGSGINTIESSIIADNHAIYGHDFYGEVINASFNLVGIGTSNNIINGDASNQVGSLSSPLDPRLAGLANNGGLTKTRAIAWCSPGHDAGSNPLGLADDQRGYGYARSVFSHTDIGAYELQ